MGGDHRQLPSEFYAELEALAAVHRSVEIIFRSGEGGRSIIRDRIAGLYTLEGREWLRTGSGLVIGLDKLIQVDGKIPSNYC